MEEELNEYLKKRWEKLSPISIRLLHLDTDVYIRNVTLAVWIKNFYEMKVKELEEGT